MKGFYRLRGGKKTDRRHKKTIVINIYKTYRETSRTTGQDKSLFHGKKRKKERQKGKCEDDAGAGEDARPETGRRARRGNLLRTDQSNIGTLK